MIESQAIRGLMGRPRRKRKFDRVSYNLDSKLRGLLSDWADRDGRSEGSQIEQLILVNAAIEQLEDEGEPITLSSINARIRRNWEVMIAEEDEEEGES